MFVDLFDWWESVWEKKNEMGFWLYDLGPKEMDWRRRKEFTLLSLWSSFLFLWWLVAEKMWEK